MSASDTFDVVFIGAGHNALIAATYLAKAGRRVCLLDQGDSPGGWLRTEELTLPGFLHDTFSALHPIFVGGPVFSELGNALGKHGLEYGQGNVSTGASFPDGRSAVVHTVPEAFSAELDRLGERQAWTRFMAEVAPQLNSLLPLLAMDLASPEATATLNQLRRETCAALPFTTLLSTSGLDLLDKWFRSEELVMTWLPWLLHIGVGPRDAGGALWSVILMAALVAGNPTPVGGSGRLAEALTKLVLAHGGQIRTNIEVDSVVIIDGRATGGVTTTGEHLTAKHAVIASTTPDQLYGRLLRDASGISAATREQARRYQYRRGCLQIGLALSSRPHFIHNPLHSVGRLHLSLR